MQKCQKCSREFCSPLNFKRHTRVHRRTLIANKEPLKNRELLAAFWDELSLEESKDILSFNDVKLKELPASTVIETLANSFCTRGVLSLPRDYVKAGSILLSTLRNIFLGGHSVLKTSSEKLFNVLDDASERTFLSGETADAQKYVFDGEDARQCLELQNLIATTSFLFEKQLMKAWIAKKDAEALRCHKLLVEEEEAEQKREAALSKRKLQKKQRRKQKSREQLNEHNRDFNIEVDAVEETPASARTYSDIPASVQESASPTFSDVPASAQESAPQTFSDMPASAKESAPPTHSDSISDSQDLSQNFNSIPGYTQTQSNEPLGYTQAQVDTCGVHIHQERSQIIEPKTVGLSGQRRSALIRWHEFKLQRERNRFHAKNNNISQLYPPKDRVTTNQVWVKKLKDNSNKESLKSQSVQEDTCHPEEEKGNCEMMIGSISITLKSGINKQQDRSCYKPQDTRTTENSMLKMKYSLKATSGQSVTSQRVTFKYWSPVSRATTKSMPTFDRESKSMEPGPTMEKVQEQIANNESLSTKNAKDDLFNPDEPFQGNSPFSVAAAKEFLATRWKVAVSADHVVWSRIST